MRSYFYNYYFFQQRICFDKYVRMFINILIIIYISGIFTFLFSENILEEKRIISLNSALTETLYILKAEDKLIGCTYYCERPKNNPGIIKLASTFSANIEQIINLKPNLILTSGLTSKQTLQTMKKFNIEVVDFKQPKNFNDICEQFIKVGKYIGKEYLAKQIVLEYVQKVNDLENKSKKNPKKKVFFQIGKDPLFTAHEESYINDLLIKTNCINIGITSKQGFFNMEEVISINPDIIFYVSMLGNSEEEASFWKSFKSLKAVKNNAVYCLDTYEICSAIPESFYNSMKKIINLKSTVT